MATMTASRGVAVAGPSANDLVEACAEIGLEALSSLGPGVTPEQAMRQAMAAVLADLRLVVPSPSA